MMDFPWHLDMPLDAIVFDCDGTLTHLEGINELARTTGLLEKVRDLTEKAMGETGLNASLYQQRLALVKPNRDHLAALGDQYFAARTPDIDHVINLFTRLNKSIYIISAGLKPAVSAFATLLKVPQNQVTAVDIIFDHDGNFLDYEQDSPLVGVDGKVKFVEQIKKRHPRILYVGDGLNDVPAQPYVTRFVGFGGAFHYAKVAEQCAYYINVNTMAPILPLGLTSAEAAGLTLEEQALYSKGLQAITSDGVTILPDKKYFFANSQG